MKRKSEETEETKEPKKEKLKTPETIDDILNWTERLIKKDVDSLCRYVKEEIEFLEEECGEEADEDDIKDIISYYNYDERTVKLARVKPSLIKLNKMIGMESIKKTIVDLILYYIQNFHEPNSDYLHTIITGPPGCGKCLHPETEIRLSTGGVIKAKDVKVDHYLMGETGEPRRVISTTGLLTDQMFRIHQSHGESYTVNSEHILTLALAKEPVIENNIVLYADYYDIYKKKFNTRYDAENFFKKILKLGERIDINLDDYLKRSKNWKKWFKGTRSVITYFANMNIEERLRYLDRFTYYRDLFVRESEYKKTLDIIYSLGWSCKTREIVYQYGKGYIVHIQGHKYSRITVEPLGKGYYCGFELEDNGAYNSGRFLLKDFTITHNTSVAEIIGEIYSGLGILETCNFTHLSRTDLIAEYLGQSAIKTKKELTKCLGGVAFIDEAYSLAPTKKDKDSFAKEVIDTLNQFLSEHKDDFVCILAGYKEDIDENLFSINKGLSRRFPWRFNIDKYNAKDLVNILYKKVEEIGWSIESTLESNCENKVWLELFFQSNEKYFKHFGGDIETFITKCKFAHVKRVFCESEKESNGSNEKLKKILNIDDLIIGLKEHKLHYGEKNEDIPPLGMYS